jgi:hypothetical protein
MGRSGSVFSAVGWLLATTNRVERPINEACLPAEFEELMRASTHATRLLDCSVDSIGEMA